MKKLDSQDSQIFSYGKLGCFAIGIPILMILLLVPLTIFGLTAYSILALIGQDLPDKAGIEILAMLGILVFLLGIIFPSINQYNVIRVNKDGLQIRVFSFYFFWKSILWEDVLNLQKSYLPDNKLKPIWVIQVKNLTIWHQFLGLQHLFKWTPVIVLTSDFESREKFLDIIREKIGRS